MNSYNIWCVYRFFGVCIGVLGIFVLRWNLVLNRVYVRSRFKKDNCIDNVLCEKGKIIKVVWVGFIEERDSN